MTNNDELALIAKAALKAGQGSKEMVEFRVTANPANILALLAERDADKKQLESWRSLAKQNIAEHEKAVIALDAARLRICELESKLAQNESWSLAAQKYIADLEAMTVNIGVDCESCGGNGLAAIDHGDLGVEHMVCPKCAAAGIKLEVGE